MILLRLNMTVTPRWALLRGVIVNDDESETVVYPTAVVTKRKRGQPPIPQYRRGGGADIE